MQCSKTRKKIAKPRKYSTDLKSKVNGTRPTCIFVGFHLITKFIVIRIRHISGFAEVPMDKNRETSQTKHFFVDSSSVLNNVEHENNSFLPPCSFMNLLGSVTSPSYCKFLEHFPSRLVNSKQSVYSVQCILCTLH